MNEQFKKLARNYDWFGFESRIIITIQDKSIVMTWEEILDQDIVKQPNRFLAYEVGKIYFNQALQLFNSYAFRRDLPFRRGSRPNDYHNLSKHVILSLGNIPLALEVISSFLSCRDS